MDWNQRKLKLGESILNLSNRKGQLTIGDIEAEVINYTCLQLIQDKKESILDYIEYAENYTKAAETFFKEYDESHSAAAQLCIVQNMAWEGNYDFIKKYYLEKHGVQIDKKNETKNIIFEAKYLHRYEFNIKKIEEFNPRRVILTLSNNEDRLMVEIIPSLTPKGATKISNKNNIKMFRGDDPDYEFSIFYNSNNEVEKFMFERKDTNVKYFYL